MAKKSKNNKQLNYVLIVMAVLILLVVGIYFMLKIPSTIQYKGLTFYEDSFGDIPVWRYTYYFPSDSGGTIKYNLMLRTNPIDLEKIPFDGKVVYRESAFVYVSVNGTGLEKCPYSGVAISSLASFLVNNQVQVKGASPDRVEANATGVRWANCDTHPDNKVILIQASNETAVRINGDCHIINVNNCEVIPVIEKFQLQSILDARD